MEKILIITGGNKGIGSGIVEAYLAHNYKVFSIARSSSNTKAKQGVVQFTFDLSQRQGLEELLESIIALIAQDQVAEITLINNAGTLGNINPLTTLPDHDIEHTVKLNTIAPLILTSHFLRLTQHWAAKKQVINISSGAATKPYFGWTVYCTTKAALDMMTKAVALEQNSLPNGARLLAIYPGVVDTAMQAQIRTSSKDNFTEIERFLELKESGQLADQDSVGRTIFNLAHDPDLENGSIIRVEDKRTSVPNQT